MSKAAVVLSVLALAGSGYTAWKTGVFCCSSCTGASGACGQPAPDELATLSARIRTLEEQLPVGRPPAPIAAPHAAPDSSGLASAPMPVGLAPDAGGTTSTADVIAALEKRLATLEETEKGRSKALEFATAEGGPGPQIAFAGPKMYGSVADAAKDLDLSPRQKDDFERAVADAKKEMDELKKIPDSDGKTWEEVEKESMPKLGEGAMTLDLGALMGYPSRKIPGRTETFGQAQKRIQDGAKSRMRDTLTPDQQKKFSTAHVDPMIGGSSGAMFSFGFSTDVVDDTAMK